MLLLVALLQKLGKRHLERRALTKMHCALASLALQVQFLKILLVILDYLELTIL